MTVYSVPRSPYGALLSDDTSTIKNKMMKMTMMMITLIRSKLSGVGTGGGGGGARVRVSPLRVEGAQTMYF